jgi:hypothetical protein
MASLACSYHVWGAFDNDRAAAVAAFGPKVNDPIRDSDQLDVVLNE